MPLRGETQEIIVPHFRNKWDDETKENEYGRRNMKERRPLTTRLWLYKKKKSEVEKEEGEAVSLQRYGGGGSVLCYYFGETSNNDAVGSCRCLPCLFLTHRLGRWSKLDDPAEVRV
jgi:hypothetical protein